MQFKKIIKMSFMLLFILFLMPVSSVYATTDLDTALIDIEPYTGSITPSTFLYQFKIMFENTHELLTFNAIKKAELQMQHADLRLSELKSDLNLNNTQNVEQLMTLYTQQLNKVQMNLNKIQKQYMSANIIQQFNQQLNQVQNRLQVHAQVITAIQQQDYYQNQTQEMQDMTNLKRQILNIEQRGINELD